MMKREMEEILIYKVQEKRVLYDINLAHYKDNKARNQAWEEIATELGLKAIECRDMWCKLRNSYNNARKRRLKPGNAFLGKWKYEDQMSFVIPFLGTSCEGSNWASQKYKLLDSPTRKDRNYTIDETVIDATGSDDEVIEADIRSDTITSSKVVTSSSKSSNNHEQLRNRESLSENTSLGKIMAHIKPMSPDKINNFHSRTVSCITPSKEAVILVEDEDDACANHFTLHENSEVDLERNSSEFDRQTDTDRRMNDDKSTLAIVIKKPNSTNSSDNQDECVEEEYYLRLARMARKLKPPDRIKLRETVSRIVIDALINSLPED